MARDNKNIYITMLGRSIWAVLNTYYAVLKEERYAPDEIIIYVEGKSDTDQQENIDKTIKGLEAISRHFEISPDIGCKVISDFECDVDTDDEFVKAALCISKFINENREKDNSIALDITPGKKTLVAGSLLPITLKDIDHLFYLSINKIRPDPFMMIPFKMHELNDFKEQVMGVMNETGKK